MKKFAVLLSAFAGTFLMCNTLYAETTIDDILARFHEEINAATAEYDAIIAQQKNNQQTQTETQSADSDSHDGGGSVSEEQIKQTLQNFCKKHNALSSIEDVFSFDEPYTAFFTTKELTNGQTKDDDTDMGYDNFDCMLNLTLPLALSNIQNFEQDMSCWKINGETKFQTGSYITDKNHCHLYEDSNFAAIFVSKFGVNENQFAGALSGLSNCNNQPGKEHERKTTINYTKNKGQNCWCKVKYFIGKGKNFIKLDQQWFYSYGKNEKDTNFSCERDCPEYCANDVDKALGLRDMPTTSISSTTVSATKLPFMNKLEIEFRCSQTRVPQIYNPNEITESFLETAFKTTPSETTGDYCWCRLKSYDTPYPDGLPKGQYKWHFMGSEYGNCAQECPKSCAKFISDQDDNLPIEQLFMTY